MEHRSIIRRIKELDKLNNCYFQSKELSTLIPYLVDRIKAIYQLCCNTNMSDLSNKKCSRLAYRISYDIRTNNDGNLEDVSSFPSVHTDMSINIVTQKMYDAIGECYSSYKMLVDVGCLYPDEANPKELCKLFWSITNLIDDIVSSCQHIREEEPPTKKSYKLASETIAIICGKENV